MLNFNQQMDPIEFAKQLWPHVRFYDKQQEIIYSFVNNRETFVVAGNMLGKDFVAGFIALWFFLTRHPCRIVTTSVTEEHLDVLWGEIGNFISTSRLALDVAHGGALIRTHRRISKIVNGEICPKSYLRRMVAAPDKLEKLGGHHIPQTGDGIPRTAFMVDEASGVLDEYYNMGQKWRNRTLIFGNPWPCSNFFFRAVKGDLETDDPGGSILHPNGKDYYRWVSQITAEHSPNVQLGLIQKANGEEPTSEILIPGVKPYDEYVENRHYWDKIQQCVGLDAEFYEGVEIKLFPPDRLAKARAVAIQLERRHGKRRRGKTMGIDPAEGGDNSVWTIGDSLGFIHQYAKQTADTTEINDITLQLMREFGIIATNVIFDRGGGGKEHADRLRRDGYNVRTVAFGESVIPERRRGTTQLEARKLQDEERYAYFNRRAEMYGLLSRAIDPNDGLTYGIPGAMSRLHRQLKVIPRLRNQEGRLWLPPKNKPPGTDKSVTKTMIELVGHSPDEADSAVLCYYGLVKKPRRSRAGAM